MGAQITLLTRKQFSWHCSHERLMEYALQKETIRITEERGTPSRAGNLVHSKEAYPTHELNQRAPRFEPPLRALSATFFMYAD